MGGERRGEMRGEDGMNGREAGVRPRMLGIATAEVKGNVDWVLLRVLRRIQC